MNLFPKVVQMVLVSAVISVSGVSFAGDRGGDRERGHYSKKSSERHSGDRDQKKGGSKRHHGDRDDDRDDDDDDSDGCNGGGGGGPTPQQICEAAGNFWDPVAMTCLPYL